MLADGAAAVRPATEQEEQLKRKEKMVRERMQSQVCPMSLLRVLQHCCVCCSAVAFVARQGAWDVVILQLCGSPSQTRSPAHAYMRVCVVRTHTHARTHTHEHNFFPVHVRPRALV